METLCNSCSNSFGLIGLNLENSCEKQKTAANDEDNEPLQNETPPPKKFKTDETEICQHCLGLLDPEFQENVLKHVTDHYLRENYVGLQTFQLCLRITPSLIMQHAAMMIFLKSRLNPDQFSLPVDVFVKEELKKSLIQAFSSKLNLGSMINSPFQILVEFAHAEADSKCHELVTATTNIKKKRRGQSQEVTITMVQNAVESSFESFEKLFILPHQTNYSSPCSIKVSFLHDSIYVAGRYNKYSRQLSQTPWVVDGVKKAETSVQDLICNPLQSVLRYDTVRLSSSGREDVDVRMLGSGRPFLLELLNPKVVNLNHSDFKFVEEQINSSTQDVAVKHLKLVNQKAGEILKIGEEEKKKEYSALVWSTIPLTPEQLSFLNNIHDLKIAQKTPMRVLHRRSLTTRERTIYTLNAKYIDPHHFRLNLLTQAGTYIKEFVHGDFGRTLPNMRKLMGHDVDIVALDVTNLELDWPPTE